MLADSSNFYDVNRHDFTIEPGVFNLMVGSSSEDIRLKTDVQVSNSMY